jgi:2-C-methyl-D-erythritol 4-phosphate cytidylyltransferase
MDDERGARVTAAAVIVAAGASVRMAGAGGSRKPFLELGGRTVLELSCAAFQRAAGVEELVIVAREEDLERVRGLAPTAAAVVPGGNERADSVRLGVAAVSLSVDVICVHDAARPLIRTATIERAIAVAAREGASLVAAAMRDTVKRSVSGRAKETLDRSRLWAAQTPQCFRSELLRDLLQRAERDGFRPTDDSALHERYVGPVPIVEGESTNLKLTTPCDLAIAAAILAEREKELR